MIVDAAWIPRINTWKSCADAACFLPKVVDSIGQDMEKCGDTGELSLAERPDVLIGLNMNDAQQFEKYLHVRWRASKV